MSFILQYQALDDEGNEVFSAVDVVADVVGTFKSGEVQVQIIDPERENKKNPTSLFFRFQLGELVRDATKYATNED